MKKLGNKKINRWLSAAILAVFVAAIYFDWDDKPSSTESTSTRPLSTTQGPYELRGKVSHVADGDTINLYVDGQRQRIRLANIDAPESDGRSDRPGQPYANAAAKALTAMVADKTLSLNCFEQDHYGRHVCNVPLPNDKSKTANQELVAQGLAWAYTGSNERYLRDKNLKKVQAKAKAAGLGLWQDKSPVAPWTWRYECWQKKRCN